MAIDPIAYPWAVGSEADGVDVARQRHGGDLVAHEQLHAQRRVQVHFTIVGPGAEQVAVLEQGTRILQRSKDRPTELFVQILVNLSHNFLITFSRIKKLMMSLRSKYPFIGLQNPKKVASKNNDVVVVVKIWTQGWCQIYKTDFVQIFSNPLF